MNQFVEIMQSMMIDMKNEIKTNTQDLQNKINANAQRMDRNMKEMRGDMRTQ